MKKYLAVLALAMVSFATLSAQEMAADNGFGEAAFVLPSDMYRADVQPVDSVQADTTKQRRNFFQKFVGYFADANKPKNKPFDFNVIGGPFYFGDVGVGVGLVGAGLYRIDKKDLSLQPCNASIFGAISTKGFYQIGVKGNNFFTGDKYRLNYKLFLFSFPSTFWGIGYNEGNDDAKASGLKYMQARFSTDFMIRVADNFYVGPVLSVDYANATRLDSTAREMLDNLNQPLQKFNYGVGVNLTYDSRDVVTNPHRGIYIYAAQTFRPQWLGNGENHFNTTDFEFDAYHSAWKGAIFAYQVQGRFNFGNPTWSMMSRMGGSNSMRGYYEGRYRDKHMVTAQFELRQRIWKRIGMTAWAGAGNVFGYDAFDIKHTLPNFGLGFRWEFKKNMNIRLDYGFGGKAADSRNADGKGKLQQSFIFNISEAF